MIQNITKHCKTLKGLYQCKTLLNIAKYCRDCNGAKQTGFMLPQATIRRAARCSTAKVAHCYAEKSSWAKVQNAIFFSMLMGAVECFETIQLLDYQMLRVCTDL